MLGHDARPANGFGRAVIANADEDELEPVDMRYHREAALGDDRRDRPGPRGRGERRAAEARSPGARSGCASTVTRSTREFRTVWNAAPRNVVLVEASDVARAAAYRPMAAPEQRATMRARALRGTDKLVGKLLADVIPRRDAVFVVGPYHSPLRRELTVASLRAPGVQPGAAEVGDDAPQRLRADRRHRTHGAAALRHRPPRGDGGPPVQGLARLGTVRRPG